MKRLILLSLFTLLGLFVIAGIAFGGITGSAHDFSGESWNKTGEVCVVCHAPHPSQTQTQDAPLWNHEITSATFTLYSSDTLDSTPGQPDGVSKLCLSCHDGTVAVDSFGGVTNGSQFVSGEALIGTDLSNDHPISITYDSTLANKDGGLYDPSTTSSGLGDTIQKDMLFGGELQCASCHDVHNSSGNEFLLVKSNTGSALCLTCHNK